MVKHKLEWYMGWNEGASLTELWGQITWQLWHVPKASHGREEQDASCLVADVLCPAAVRAEDWQGSRFPGG